MARIVRHEQLVGRHPADACSMLFMSPVLWGLASADSLVQTTAVAGRPVGSAAGLVDIGAARDMTVEQLKLIDHVVQFICYSQMRLLNVNDDAGCVLEKVGGSKIWGFLRKYVREMSFACYIFKFNFASQYVGRTLLCILTLFVVQGLSL
jgi:hypothetical protein